MMYPYANSVWDLHLHKNIYYIDQVQRRDAHWVLQNYDCYISVTSMQQEVKLTNTSATLILFYKARQKIYCLPNSILQ